VSVADDRAKLVEALVALAEQAGAVIMPHFRNDVAVEKKADSSPVTAADRAADRVILDGLARLAPGIPAITEEEVAEGRIPDISGGRYWLVDPLDGTKEFIAGRDEFTVNIALIERGRPVLGVVGAPALGVMYAASGPGHVTRRDKGGAPVAISARTVPADGLVVLSSRSHANQAELDHFLVPLVVKERIVVGSSLKFCWIAEGRGDLYPRFGPTNEWDTAAGHAVLAAAGGSVRTLDGADLGYGKKSFRNPHFIARGHDNRGANG
jgi:3'(2'), 5'-bisphosphate nucleotidase